MRLIAQIVEGQRQLVANLIPNNSREADRTGLGEGFQSRGDVNAVAEQIVAIDHDIANMDADAVLHRDAPVELTVPLAFKRRGVEMRLVLPEVAMQNDRLRCDPTLIKAIARGRAWFEELAAGRARSLRELAERDGITRRYVRRLIDLAFLSPELVEAILQGRQSVELTATRLAEFDLPLDWHDQRRLLAL